MSVAWITAHLIQLGFVLASDVAIGGVLLLAIGRVVGADWSVATPLFARLAWLAVLGLAGYAISPADRPENLTVWSAGWFEGLRAAAAVLALAWAGGRLAAGASVTFAAVTLTVYAALVTPVASDWLLAGEPGHSVSAAGMMLFVQQFGAACAAVLVSGIGGERLRADLSKLLVAAALGLCYLTYMDYLIIWFGNLPERVPFYLHRAAWPAAAAPVLALLGGVLLPIGALALRPGEQGRRVAGWGWLAALFLWDAWWLGAGPVSAAGALVALGVALWALWRRRETAHG